MTARAAGASGWLAATRQAVWAAAAVRMKYSPCPVQDTAAWSSAQTAWRVAANQPLAPAARAVIDQIGAMGGDGGLIALDRHGNRADPFNSQGMKRAWLDVSGEIGVEVFG